MPDCVFCEIAAGHSPASVVYEDDLALAFLDIHPVNAGHTLVVPKGHAPDLAGLEGSLGKHLFGIAMDIAAALRRSGLRCDGINLFLADGEAAFQDVFHVHLHVIPRFEGDSFKIDADWSVSPPREELDRIARAIHQHLRP